MKAVLSVVAWSGFLFARRTPRWKTSASAPCWTGITTSSVSASASRRSSPSPLLCRRYPRDSGLTLKRPLMRPCPDVVDTSGWLCVFPDYARVAVSCAFVLFFVFTSVQGTTFWYVFKHVSCCSSLCECSPEVYGCAFCGDESKRLFRSLGRCSLPRTNSSSLG